MSSPDPTAMRVLVIANQKGGVGKTTTAINLGTALAAIGETVLIVDLDPQGNASTGLGIDKAARQVSTYDVLLMRQDPPFDMNYTTITHILERLHPKTYVINPPAAVRNAPEKILVTEFPELMPPTLVTRDRAMIQAFRKEHGNIIVKPLYGNGGAGVFFIEEGSHNLVSLLELFETAFPEPFMIQRYLPEVRQGIMALRAASVAPIESGFVDTVRDVLRSLGLTDEPPQAGGAVSVQISPKKVEVVAGETGTSTVTNRYNEVSPTSVVPTSASPVTQPSAPRGTLPFTGSATLPLTVGGAALIAAGAAALLASRRRAAA